MAPPNPARAESFTDLVRPGIQSDALSRQALVGALSKRFYLGEHGKIVTNGLSSYVTVFDSDRDPKNQEILALKIRNALEYAPRFVDVREINSLLALPPKQPDYYVTLGLYLYFADECSRLRPDTTFLTALREAEVGIKKGTTTDRKELYTELMHALDTLGMKESHGKVLQEWYEKGSFTIRAGAQEDVNEYKNKKVHGAYARLARDICMQEETVPLHHAISYALGNKDKIGAMSAEEVLAFTTKLTKSKISRPIHPDIQLRLDEGDSQRMQNMLEAINAERSPNAASYLSQLNTKRAAEGILAFVPDKLLDILYRQGISVSYADAKTIDTCLPETEFPGDSIPRDRIKGNKGFFDPSSRTLFISNGNGYEAGECTQEKKHMMAAQTLLHESMHRVLYMLTEKERKQLLREVKQVHREIQKANLPDYFRRDLESISATHLKNAVDHESSHYSNYGKKITRVEVACNLYGLMHTEFPYPPPQDADTPNPYRDLPSLGVLAKKLEEAVSLAHQRCKVASANIGPPSQDSYVNR